MLRCIELYAGCGGMALGLKKAGFEHVALVDCEKACVQTLVRNGFASAIHSRVEDLDLSPYGGGISLLAGGPPCQPFSLGGVDGGRGDKRNGWEATLRAVEQCRPRAVMFENVSGLLRPKFADYLESVLSRLEAMGYRVVVERANAAHYGVPQVRKRVFVIGFLEKVAWDAYRSPPRREGVVTLREALAPLGPPNGENGHVVRGNARTYEGHTGSDMDGVAKTITSGVNGPGGGANTLRLANGSVRYFTIREAALIQTFPDDFTFDDLSWTAAFKQIGNAVPVQLAQVFGDAVATALRARKVGVGEGGDKL